MTHVLQFGRWRTAARLAGLLVLVAIPAVGIFRIDLAAGSLLVLGRPVHLRDFTVIAGLAIVLATGPLLLVTTMGTFWCGWLCPQNTVSEWATRLTHRLLGSRADVDVDGHGMQAAPSKNRAANWARLGASFLLAALVLGAVPLFYFLPPGVVWSLLTFGESAQFARFMSRLYVVAVAAVFVNVALLRYFICNYACLYRFGVLLFRNRDLPHVAYDAGRAAECAKCNYCRTECPTRIDPTDIKPFDRCINCAECIDACTRLQAKRISGKPALLRFEVAGARDARRGLATRVLHMFGWHGALFLVGVVLVITGLAGASP